MGQFVNKNYYLKTRKNSFQVKYNLTHFKIEGFITEGSILVYTFLPLLVAVEAVPKLKPVEAAVVVAADAPNENPVAGAVDPPPKLKPAVK